VLFAVALPASVALARANEQARVVTLAPHITELMFEAGAGERIVGTVTSSDFPAAVKSLPRVGDGLNVNPEKLIGLQPTDVLAWQHGGAAAMLQPLLNSLQIKLDYVEPQTVADIPEAVERLGQRFGQPEQARHRAARLQGLLTDLRRRYEFARPVTVLIQIGQNPPYTLGNDRLTNDALSYCGARNLYRNTTIAAPLIQQEFVVTHPPDVILVPSNQPLARESVEKHWELLGLRAAQEGHVKAVDPDAFLRPGPRLITILPQVCAMIDTVRADP
jgi:iron complex transport system substrate-binding protein/vitamin B12 transport system substrate-binding protein